MPTVSGTVVSKGAGIFGGVVVLMLYVVLRSAVVGTASGAATYPGKVGATVGVTLVATGAEEGDVGVISGTVAKLFCAVAVLLEVGVPKTGTLARLFLATPKVPVGITGGCI